MRTTRLRVTLRDVDPTVLRVVDVPAAATLPELHLILQAAIGWTNSHLHLFVTEECMYGKPDDLADDLRDEDGVALSPMPTEFAYHYDFGDGWEHDVEVLGAGDAVPGCRYGENRCPPEDCGGPPGYAELLATPGAADGLADFDQTATDLLVRQIVGEVPQSVRLLLDLTADGVRLTPGGRLPRAVVREVQQHRRDWYPLDRLAHVEEDLLALTALHDVLRRVGLLRLSNRVLCPIRAADDDLEVVRRLRRCFGDDVFGALLADVSVASLVVDGPQRSGALAHRVYPLLGPGWAAGANPLTADDVHHDLMRLRAVLEGLDLIECGTREWHAGPSARLLLPRATSLAAHWSPSGH